MAKSDIEWLKNPQTGKPGYSLNPVKGLCPMKCSYCYAARMYKRFKWNPEIRFEDCFAGKLEGKPGDKYFIGSTMELFGEWVEDKWLDYIFTWVQGYPSRTFIFLTKRPDRLPDSFPSNCWVGVSATNDVDFTNRAWKYLKDIMAMVKFVSFEPLLDWGMSIADTEFTLASAGVNWVIIGQQTPTSAKTAPKTEWIKTITKAADNLRIPVFVKDNLRDLYPGMEIVPFRHEFPKVKVTA